MKSPPTETAAYTALAAGYDLVMEHVDYDIWAEFVHALIRRWGKDVTTILELGCGTGSLGLALLSVGDYRYVGTDRVAAMLHVAREKADFEGSDLQFAEADFTNFAVDSPVDAILLLFDGLNYLVDDESIRSAFDCVFRALIPGGLFIFDLSTPANSINNAEFFEDEGEEDAFSYRRSSSYDPATRLHQTTFDIEVEGESFREVHVQRAYPMDHIAPFVEEAGLEILATLDGFGMDPATPDSERVHCVARKPYGPPPEDRTGKDGGAGPDPRAGA